MHVIAFLIHLMNSGSYYTLLFIDSSIGFGNVPKTFDDVAWLNLKGKDTGLSLQLLVDGFARRCIWYPPNQFQFYSSLLCINFHLGFGKISQD